MVEGLIALEICAPDKEHVTLEAESVTLPGAAGIFTITPGHTALFSTLAPGPLVVQAQGGAETFYAVHGGFAEVKGDNTLLVLADNFEAEEDIDHARAAAAEERAQERLRKITPDINAMRAEAALARAIARLRTAGRNGYG